MSHPLDAPEFGDVAVTIGLDADGTSTGEVVGIRVIPMQLGTRACLQTGHSQRRMAAMVTWVR